ncbi:pilus assembly protein PilO [Bacillus sp. USDA818B3_A]|uniref:pilus assembly protein PilO n=1 Tax=Bacillus sp. USDA818B3_A TaxID=2698834 RepID=UPI0013687BD9|nr:pilus assembly protein PilO [Bacillus sp. USDA818B3_A]
MKLHFSKKDKWILAAGALLLVLIFVYAQFFSLSPLKSELSVKQQSLESEQKLLETISEKNAETTSQTAEDTKELQKKLPVKPLQEQLILDLEKAETLSNSKISSMGFSKDVDVSTASADTNTSNQQTSGTQATTNKSPTAQNTTTQQTTDQQTAAAQTPALKKLTVSLKVESPTYKDLEKFIETLESLQRIVVIESISYSGGQEITSLVQETQPLSYSLTFSAFYMPGLTDLVAQLPKIDSPAPAGKENPLSEFPDTTATTQP